MAPPVGTTDEIRRYYVSKLEEWLPGYLQEAGLDGVELQTLDDHYKDSFDGEKLDHVAAGLKDRTDFAAHISHICQVKKVGGQKVLFPLEQDREPPRPSAADAKRSKLEQGGWRGARFQREEDDRRYRSRVKVEGPPSWGDCNVKVKVENEDKGYPSSARLPAPGLKQEPCAKPQWAGQPGTGWSASEAAGLGAPPAAPWGMAYQGRADAGTNTGTDPLAQQVERTAAERDAATRELAQAHEELAALRGTLRGLSLANSALKQAAQQDKDTCVAQAHALLAQERESVAGLREELRKSAEQWAHERQEKLRLAEYFQKDNDLLRAELEKTKAQWEDLKRVHLIVKGKLQEGTAIKTSRAALENAQAAARRAEAKSAKLEQQVKKFNKELHDINVEKEKLRGQVTGGKVRLAKEKKEVTRLKEQAAELEREKAELVCQLGAASAEGEPEGQVAAAHEETKRLRESMKAARKAGEALKQRLVVVEGERDKMIDRCEAAEAARDDALVKHATLMEKYALKHATLGKRQREKEALQESHQALQEEKEALQGLLSAAQGQLGDAKRERDDALAKLAAAQEAAAQLSRCLPASATDAADSSAAQPTARQVMPAEPGSYRELPSPEVQSVRTPAQSVQPEPARGRDGVETDARPGSEITQVHDAYEVPDSEDESRGTCVSVKREQPCMSGYASSVNGGLTDYEGGFGGDDDDSDDDSVEDVTDKFLRSLPGTRLGGDLGDDEEVAVVGEKGQSVSRKKQPPGALAVFLGPSQQHHGTHKRLLLAAWICALSALNGIRRKNECLPLLLSQPRRWTAWSWSA
eukprot:jgi/Mesvir1/21385/Mv20867-RA.2